MAVTVTNSTLAEYNSDVAVTKNAATADTVDTAEVFTITPTKPDHKVAIFIEVGPTHGAVAFSIAAGDYWAASSAKTGSVAQSTTKAIVLEGAKFKAQAGTIALTLTPASGKKLMSDHAAKVYVVELP